jgi:hypothetical protein
MKISIRFTFSRTPLRRMHQAVQHTEADSHWNSVLFPSAKNVQTHAPQEFNALNRFSTPGFFWFERHLNTEQRKAVSHILSRHGSQYCAPYIIFGPPGTGMHNGNQKWILQEKRWHWWRQSISWQDWTRSCTSLFVLPPTVLQTSLWKGWAKARWHEKTFFELTHFK